MIILSSSLPSSSSSSSGSATCSCWSATGDCVCWCVTSVARFNRQIDIYHPPLFVATGELHQDFYSMDLNYTCPPSPSILAAQSAQCAPVWIVADARSICAVRQLLDRKTAGSRTRDLTVDCIFTNSTWHRKPRYYNTVISCISYLGVETANITLIGLRLER